MFPKVLLLWSFPFMIEYIFTFLGIYFLTLFKFIAGPVLGHAAGYSLIEIMAVTVSGMMSSVIIFTYLGAWVKKQWDIRVTPKRKRFTKKSRRMIKIWQKSGAVGVAFLTPLLLTPIGGTIILTTFGVERRKIIGYMLVSAIWWSFVFGISIERLLEIAVVRDLLL